MVLHPDEVPLDEHVVRRLLRAQRPDLADRTVELVGGGTDNTVYRIGADHVGRFPRSRAHVAGLAKELAWLPRLRPHLPLPIPEPVHAGRPDEGHPLPWAVLAWIDGELPGAQTVPDPVRYGRQLAGFVSCLHGADLMGSSRRGDLDWYRGHPLAGHADEVAASFTAARAHEDELGVDLDRLEEAWREALHLPAPTGPHVWLHGDLRPSNLLVRDGQLSAVLDFGSISVGHPDAEHALAWDLPPQGRRAYRDGLGVDDPTWARARGWALAFAVGGATSYRGRLESLVAECHQRLHQIESDLA